MKCWSCGHLISLKNHSSGKVENSDIPGFITSDQVITPSLPARGCQLSLKFSQDWLDGWRWLEMAGGYKINGPDEFSGQIWYDQVQQVQPNQWLIWIWRRKHAWQPSLHWKSVASPWSQRPAEQRCWGYDIYIMSFNDMLSHQGQICYRCLVLLSILSIIRTFIIQYALIACPSKRLRLWTTESLMSSGLHLHPFTSDLALWFWVHDCFARSTQKSLKSYPWHHRGQYVRGCATFLRSLQRSFGGGRRFFCCGIIPQMTLFHPLVGNWGACCQAG